MIKAGQIGGVAYKKVAYIGFSIGSVAGVSLSAQYPHAADAMILHGFSWDVTNLYPGYLAGLQAPVNTLERPEWKQYSSYYQSQSTPASRQAVVFFGDYDPAILPIDFALRDMVGNFNSCCLLAFYLSLSRPKDTVFCQCAC